MPPHLTGTTPDADIEAELEAHLERLEQELRDAGMDAAAARAEAERRFGDPARIRAAVRDIDRPWERTLRRWAILDSLLDDLRYGARQLRRSPGFAVVAVLTLALGVGLTTAMFTVVNGVLLRPLPFPDADRLFVVGAVEPDEDESQLYVYDQHYDDIEREMSAFTHVSTYMVYPPTTLTGAGDAARLTTAFVTERFFDVLGVRPILGGGFPPQGDSGSTSVVVLAHELWRSRFGEDPEAVGRTAVLDGVPRTIVGVMPPGFDYPSRTQAWVPLDAHPMRAEGLSFANPVIARMRDDTSAELARAEMTALAGAAQWSRGDRALEPRLVPLKSVMVDDSRYPLLLFAGAVALVLLISCTNVANLLLMRAGTREQEIGLRRVLGADQPRVLRQLLTEGVLLSLLGGTLGIGVAAAGVQALLALAPPGAIPRGQEIGIDLAVLTFTLAVSVAVGLVFGLAPAFKSLRRELRDAIGHAARTHTRRGLARRGLVVGELGLAMVLLTGAGLMLKSFQQVRAIELGFEPERALTFFVDLPENEYTTSLAARELHERITAGLSGLAGVESAGAANFEPFGPLAMSTRVTSEDEPERRTSVAWTVVSPDYFRALGARLLAGRAFTPGDDAEGPPVAIVSRSLAEQLWPGRDPVGRRLLRNPNDRPVVVGVVEDVARSEPTVPKEALVYFPLAQVDNPQHLRHMSYVVRSSMSAAALAASMRAVVREADSDLPVEAITTMDDVVLASMGDRLFEARVVGAFALLALLLAAVGVYGVTAYTVTERVQELGIRMALGARATQVAGMTIRQVLGLVTPGLLLGGVAAAAGARSLEASLYDVAPSDPGTYVAVALVLAGVALAAAIVPAWRATRVDPVEVLAR